MFRSLLLTLGLAVLVFFSQVQAQANPWEARHGLTSAEYQKTFNDLTSKGYRLNWVSGYGLSDNAAHYACIFEKKTSPAWVARHGLTSAEYQAAFNQYTSQGYRPVLVNGYTVKGVDYYAAIWDKSAGGAWVARHGLSSQDYQAAFDQFGGQGYRLKHVSGYAVGSSARYAAIWEKSNSNTAWVSRHGLTSDQYQTAFNQYTSQGYRLVLVNGYTVAGVDYYVAIWEKSSNTNPWVAHHGMSSSDYQRRFDTYFRQGYMLKTISGYNPAGHYAAMWSKG